MSVLIGKKAIYPNDWEYHYKRTLRVDCGCGQVHEFIREKSKKVKGQVRA